MSTDNCNENFGVNHSQFIEFLKDNPDLVKANCYSHILRNAVRYMIRNLDYIVEGLVFKMDAYFSMSAK